MCASMCICMNVCAGALAFFSVEFDCLVVILHDCRQDMSRITELSRMVIPVMFGCVGATNWLDPGNNPVQDKDF